MSDKPKPKEPSTAISGLFSIGFEDSEEGIPGVTQLLSPGAMKAKAEASERDVARLTAAKKAPMPTSLAPTVQKPVSKYGVTQAQEVPASQRAQTSSQAEPVKAPPAAQSLPPKSHPSSFGENTPAPRPLSELTALIQNPAAGTQKAPAHRSDLSALIESGNLETKPSQKSAPGLAPQSLREMGVQFELHFEVERGLFRYARMKGHAKEVFALWQQKFYFQMKLDLKALGLEAPFQEFEKNKDEFYADAFGLIEANYVQVIRLEEMPTKLYVLLSEKSLKPWEIEVRNLLNGKKASGDSNGNPDDDAFVIELAS